jgi:hypothetical protein
MKVWSTVIVNFALTFWRESKIQLNGGFTLQHLALVSQDDDAGLGFRAPARPAP